MRTAWWVLLLGCGEAGRQEHLPSQKATQRSLARGSLGAATPTATREVGTEPSSTADVVGVTVRAEGEGWRFAIAVRSPDTGCDRFADAWEVLGDDGALRYRRVLEHSHVDEQPFTRSGGPVVADAGERLWVRAHLSTGGYGRMMVGTAAGGFVDGAAPEGFGAGAAWTERGPCRY